MIRDGVRQAVLSARGDRPTAHRLFFAWLAEDDGRKHELVREYHERAGAGAALGRLIDQVITDMGTDIAVSLPALNESLDPRENPEIAARVADELGTGMADFLDELFTQEVAAYKRGLT